MKKTRFRLSYITLGVTNFTQMFAFYKSLGFSINKLSKNPEHPFAMFEMGSMILALYPKALLGKQAGCVLGSRNSAMSVSLNVSEKGQVDAFLRLAELKGATITQWPFQPEWGGYCGYFKDPEYNLWEVVWHESYQFPSDAVEK